LKALDKEIKFFGGISYDKAQWANDDCIKQLETNWNKLTTGEQTILKPDEITDRLLNDCKRYVFYVQMREFLKQIMAAKKFVSEKKLMSKKSSNPHGAKVLQSLKLAAKERAQAQHGVDTPPAPMRRSNLIASFSIGEKPKFSED